jgi:hypothetical protein
MDALAPPGPGMARRGHATRAVAIALLVLLSSCDRDSDPDASVSASGGAITTSTNRAQIDEGVPRLASVIRSSDTADVTLSPPPAEAAAVSLEVTRTELVKALGPAAVAGMDPSLALLDRPTFGVRSLLVWAFIERLPCTELYPTGAYGPPRMKVRPIDPALECIRVLVADGRTGAYLFGYSEAEHARELSPDDIGQPGTQLAP